MGWLRQREKPLFRTHRPPFRSEEWAIGQLVQHEGSVYRVTRWEELRPVRLKRGGSVGEWQVWGKKLSEGEARRELLDAAERIKDGDS